MKKIMMILSTVVLLSASMMSCSKNCGHCSENGSNGPQYCSANNHAVYDAAKASCATGGGTWTDK